MRDYELVCTACDERYDDDGWRLQCDGAHPPALLRTRYPQQRFAPSADESLLRYRCWLPGAREIATRARTAIYHSTGLGRHLGLRQLWIAFSGWWPERGATLPTGSFKDLEAVSVVRRIDPADSRTLVVSSAGNTALAFARVCSDNAIPALIIVPLRGWNDVMRRAAIGPSVRVVAIADAEYEDAIAFARDLCATGEFMLEGGVRNVGRRDGMGTVMLAATETIGALPRYYFQAVGSAAGALAAHEAALRLRDDERFGVHLPKLMLAQNAPFTPIHDAWTARSTALLPRSAQTAAQQLGRIGAFVLGNQAPPYGIAGGIRDALAQSDGATYAITNDQFGNAMSLFAELEGMGIEPAGGVAVAALIRAVAAGSVEPEAPIVLHVTGGGRSALAQAGATESAPALVVDRCELATTAVDRTRSLLD